MATGDIQDFVRRLRAALPARWFPDNAPVLTGMLTGFAANWASLYDLLTYVIKQARIATATGVFLDMIAQDFFQGRIVRRISEPDTHFRLRILSEILRPRGTRAAVVQALVDLTGVPPVIFEPADASDTGGYNVGGAGYNRAGGWGSVDLPFQAFITAFRPAGGGIASVSGYANITVGVASTGGLGGYGQGAIEWASLDLVKGAITDADIYATVAAAMPAATIGWTRGLSAAEGQVQQTLTPVGAFSRAITTARSSLALVNGALLSAGGFATGHARLFFNSSSIAITGRGVGRSAGQLTAQAGRLRGLGFATAAGRVKAIIGAGILGARGTAGSTRSKAVLTGTLPLAGQGLAKSTGSQLYGSVIILGGRGFAFARATLVGAGLAAITARGKSRGWGASTVSTTGGVSPLLRGRAAASGKLGIPALSASLTAKSRAAAHGVATVATLQSAPTPPTNVVASNATPTSVVLTWTAASGDNSINDGSLISDGGVLILSGGTYGYPPSASGAPGQLWSNGGVVSVVPGATPDPNAPPLTLSTVTAASLLATGGANLPLTAPVAGSNQLWNNGGEVWVA